MKKSGEKERLIQNQIKENGNIPAHIAIIMDGNGRWAKKKGMSRVFGHQKGVSTVRGIVEACIEIGVKYLTLYTFSTENWKRPKEEVTVLMKLLIKALKDEADRLHQNDVKLIASGNLESLPPQVFRELMDAIDKTKGNKAMTLNLALSYSGRWDILNAVKKILNDSKDKEIREENITEEFFSNYLITKGIPDPDLMIRTGGEYRISNFLLWQLAYSEIYIDSVFWPEFKKEHLYKAINEFQNRERRFGLVSEQLKNLK